MSVDTGMDEAGDGRRVGEGAWPLPVLLTNLPSPFCNPCSTVLLLSRVYFQNFLLAQFPKPTKILVCLCP